MLLDEPTSNLDIWHQLDVMNIVSDLVKKRRMTVLMALHDLNLASRYSDGIIMMKRGRIMAAGDPASVLTPENIEAIYNVEVAVRFPVGGALLRPHKADQAERSAAHASG